MPPNNPELHLAWSVAEAALAAAKHSLAALDHLMHTTAAPLPVGLHGADIIGAARQLRRAVGDRLLTDEVLLDYEVRRSLETLLGTVDELDRAIS